MSVVSQSDLTRKNVGQAEIAVLTDLSLIFITDHVSSCEGAFCSVTSVLSTIRVL